MASQAGYATFTIAAKDAASGVMGKIGNSMGKLQGVAASAFKAIAAGAAAAAVAIAGMAVAGIKGAMEDEKAQTRMVATLRARGLATKDNIAAIDALITSAQHLGITDDQVRASIETATQYTKKFSDALKINKVAQDLAIAKGIDLETATAMVGKAYAGNGKALKQLGINLQKTVYWTDVKTKTDKKGNVTTTETNKSRKVTIKGLEALALVTQQYGGIAAEVANTSAVKLEDAQIAINEAFESFGAQFLPDVANAISWFSTDVLPGLQKALQDVVPYIKNVAHFITNDFAEALRKSYTNDVQPFVDKIGLVAGGLDNLVKKLQSPELKVAFDGLGLLFYPITSQLDHFKAVLDAVIEGMRLIGLLPKAGLGGSSLPGLPMIPGAPGRGGLPTRGGPSYGEPVSVTNNITFGNDAVSFVDTKLGAAYSGGRSRTFPNR